MKFAKPSLKFLGQFAFKFLHRHLFCTFFLYLLRDRLHVLRRVIENFPHSPYRILTFTRIARSKYKQWTIAMETGGACARSTMLDTVAKRMQHFCSHFKTKEMLDDVGDDVWWKSNFVQHHPTSCNIVQHGGQTSATCWIQQCWMHQHVGFVWPGLYFSIVILNSSVVKL